MRTTLGTEEWRAIPGWEGSYEVSSHGRVRSLTRVVIRSNGHPRTIYGVMLKLTPATQTGYLTVALWRNAKKQTRTVHSVVAEAFIGPRPDGLMVCHGDGERTNNRIENLRYDTAFGNAADMRRHGSHAKARMTHCPRGHEYTPENTAIYPVNAPGRRHRKCRTCLRQRQQGRTRAKAEGANQHMKIEDWKSKREGVAA